VKEDPKRGKGSHTYFYKTIDDAEVGYPVPTSRNPVLICYIQGARRKFKLTAEDGVGDKEFYDEA
jgi:hypothetical protein